MKKLKKSFTIAMLGILGLTLPTPICADIIPRLQEKNVSVHGTKQKWEELESIVLEKASENQAVMFGDEHENCRLDNDFVIGLLPELKEQGFKYLALEIDKNTSEKSFHRIIQDYAYGKITRDKIPPVWIDFEGIKATGWFDLIDAAKKAKIEIVCYDTSPKEYSSWNEREEKAFNNLKELIFNKNPDTKVIVYCGDDHLSEEPNYTPFIRMWEESEGLTSDEKEAFKSLAFHLNEFTRDKTLTVGLRGLRIGPYYCDLKIDLKNNIYKLQDHE